MRILWLNACLLSKRDVEIGKIYSMKTQVFQLPPFPGLKRECCLKEYRSEPLTIISQGRSES